MRTLTAILSTIVVFQFLAIMFFAKINSSPISFAEKKEHQRTQKDDSLLGFQLKEARAQLVIEAPKRGNRFHKKLKKSSNVSFGTFESNPVSFEYTNAPHKALIGVFSVHNLVKERAFLRDSWIKYPFVCPFTSALSTNDKTIDGYPCLVYYAFVFGNNVVVDEPDAIMLPIKENMNDGKTKSWFNHAGEKYHHLFTYIGKCDMDTYVFATELVHILQILPARNVYFGRIIPRRKKSIKTRCVFMNGGFYLVSSEIAYWIHQNEKILPEIGNEDVVFGSWLCDNTYDVLAIGYAYASPTTLNDSAPWTHPAKKKDEVEKLYNSPRSEANQKNAKQLVEIFGW